MEAITIFISLATLIFFIAFSLRLRNWVRDFRKDIYVIRNEVRAVKKMNEAIGDSIEKSIRIMTTESLNAIGLYSLGFKFPVFLSGWSVDSFLGRYLVQYLLEHRPKCIIELGSGSSTILIARTLQILDEKDTIHITVDHEEKYLNLTRHIAQLNGLAEGVEFLHCPLVRYESLDKLWYSEFNEKLSNYKIDLLIIDGPPGQLQHMSRYPALPLLLPYMSDHCTVILDDVIRDEEQEIARRWAQDSPEFNLTLTREGHGLAILTR